MDCRISVILVLGHKWIVSLQYDLYWGSRGLYHISGTGTGTVVDCIMSVGLQLGQ